MNPLVFVFSVLLSFLNLTTRKKPLHVLCWDLHISWFVCLFGVFRPTRESFTHMETSPLPVKVIDLCSALVAIDHEQWGYFCVPQLLWLGTSVYIGHLRGPVTLAPITERFAVELSLPVFTTKVCHGWDLNTQPLACRANLLTDCATAAVISVGKINIWKKVRTNTLINTYLISVSNMS